MFRITTRRISHSAISLSFAVSLSAQYMPPSGGGGGGGTPGGSNTQVQFNDSSSFAGNAGLTFVKATGVVATTAAIPGTPISGPGYAGDGSGLSYIFGGTGGSTPDGYEIQMLPNVRDFSFITGLNDLSLVSTSYTDLANPDAYFTVTVNSTGTPDTFVWQKFCNSCGPASSPVNITGASQLLSDGVHIQFGATTGHTLNDSWFLPASHCYHTENASYNGPLGNLCPSTALPDYVFNFESTFNPALSLNGPDGLGVIEVAGGGNDNSGFLWFRLRNGTVAAPTPVGDTHTNQKIGEQTYAGYNGHGYAEGAAIEGQLSGTDPGNGFFMPGRLSFKAWAGINFADMKETVFDGPTNTWSFPGPVLLNSPSNAGHALCQKSDKTIGTCSTIVGADGSCTCN